MKKDLRKALYDIIDKVNSENVDAFLLNDIRKIAQEALDNDLKNAHAKDLAYEDIDAHGYFTVGDLVDFIKENNVNRNGKILVQRIEDFYYEQNNWNTLKVKGEFYHQAIQWNKDIDSGKYADKEQYPNFDMEKMGKKHSEEDLNNLKEEYTVANQAILYDKNHLYIALHY